jgi:pyrroloquinoline quinone biosynthesis protein B
MLKLLKNGLAFIVILLFLNSCSSSEHQENIKSAEIPSSEIIIKVLGVIQDAGYPQANCHKSCCKDLWNTDHIRKYVSCLGLIDKSRGEYYMFDATPDFKHQMEAAQITLGASRKLPDGIFLTHAHMGHYTGLMDLGREAIGSNMVPVYAMPRMHEYLINNGPWSQLVTLNNIDLHKIKSDSLVIINEDISVLPYRVPHRDEYSETVGYSIRCNGRSVLFIPDIDKWEKWDRDIIEEIKNHDASYLDGSFYANGEIPNRDMSEIPHPFLKESMALFDTLNEEQKARVHFIHFNHTNPVIKASSEAYKDIIQSGYNISAEGDQFVLK